MTEQVQTVCSHCGAVNRIPVEKLQRGPKCGRCGEAIFQGKPIELDDAGLDRQIQFTEQPILVDFWADWCAPCKMMAPQFVAAAGELEPEVRLAKVDTEQARTSAGKWGIRSIPTLILFKDGKEIARQSGVMQASQIVNWVKGALG